MTTASTRPRERAAARCLVACTVLCLLAAGCGTRRTHEELLVAQAGMAAAGGGTGSQLGTAGASSTGAPVPGATGGTATTVLGGTGGTGSGLGAADTGGGAAGGTPGGSIEGGARVANRSLVRIGLVGSLSGAAGEGFAPMADAVRVWTRWINDRGGLDGHPVELIVADDGGDPSRHRALVQEFVEQRGIVAFVANPEALTGPGSVDYLTNAGIPVIGSEGAGDWFYSSPVYFPQGSHGLALIQAGVAIQSRHMQQRNMTKAGILVCSEVQTCRDAYEKAPANYAKYGVDVTWRAQVSIAQPDFTAECLAAQRAGAEMVSVGLPANQIRSFARACARQNYRPIITTSAGAVVDDHRTDPNLQGMIVFSITAPWMFTGSALTAEFREAMAAYAPDIAPTAGHSLAWTAAKVLELAGNDLPDTVTGSDLVARLGAINGDPLAELTAPLMFNPGQPPTRTLCSFAVVVENNEFVPGNGGERVCAEWDPNL